MYYVCLYIYSGPKIEYKIQPTQLKVYVVDTGRKNKILQKKIE